MKVTCCEQPVLSPIPTLLFIYLFHQQIHLVLNCLSNVALDKCGQLRNLFVSSPDSEELALLPRTRWVLPRDVHREEVSSHIVRLSELHTAPQRHKSTSPVKEQERIGNKMPVIDWTNCSPSYPLLFMDRVCDTP